MFIFMLIPYDILEVSFMKNSPIKISKKRLKGNDGYKLFTVRVREDIVNEMDQIADKTNRSRNEIINMFIQHGLNNWEFEE